MKKRQPLILFLVFMGLLLAALINVLVGPLSNSLPQAFTGQIWPIWLIFAVLLVISALVTYWYSRLQETDKPPLPSLDKQNRQRMLAAVRAIWITGVLEHSVHDAALIALGLRELSAAVASPWRLAVQEVGHAPHDLPTGTRITKAFDDAGGKLLVLGAPGAGKTTLLLELARDLLTRAEQDEQQPIPVIFSLSSWANKQVKLGEWFVEEMKLKYQVPEKVGRAWVERDQLLPLLDGLDEVPESQRAVCVEAINAYQQRQEHGLTLLALTSRETEYLTGTARVSLRTAVAVQPLTAVQIDAYLSSAKGQLEGVRAALQSDPDLQALATTPLMLSILSLAYQGQSVEDLLATPPAERQHHLFATYVQRVLERRKASTRYTPEQTRRWLAWLAKQMIQHHHVEFYLEQLQPDWLPESKRRWYQRSIGLVLGLYLGLAYGLGAGIGSVWYGFGLVVELSIGLGIGLITWLGVGLYFGRVLGQGFQPSSQTKPTKVAIQPQKVREWPLIHRLLSLASRVRSSLDRLLFRRRFSWLEAKVSLWLLRFSRGEIEPTEALVWSWSNMRETLPGGLIAGLITGLLVWLLPAPRFGFSDIFYALGFFLLFWFSSALALGLLGGWSSARLVDRQRLRPNAGIWRSARNSAVTGLLFAVALGLIGWVISGLLFGLLDGLVNALNDGLEVGLSFGLVFGVHFALYFGLTMLLPLALIGGIGVGLFYGGMACLQHAILRLFLLFIGYTPRDYVPFLDYAADCVVLRKVGGGYSFIHQLLLGYFAELETKKVSPAESNATGA